MSNIEWPSRIFVTGIHTDAGKSYATGWLANLINKTEEASATNRNRELKAMTMKMVQTGNVGASEDIDVHRRVMRIEPTEEDLALLTAPQIFSYPCSPDLAAKIDGRRLDINAIDNAIAKLGTKYDTLIIEGAGGLMVPLEGEYLTIDFIRERKLPVVLVTNGTLGSINHTLLSLFAIKEYGLDLFAVIYNCYFDSDKIIADDTRKYIKEWIDKHFKGTLYMEMGAV